MVSDFFRVVINRVNLSLQTAISAPLQWKIYIALIFEGHLRRLMWGADNCPWCLPYYDIWQVYGEESAFGSLFESI